MTEPQQTKETMLAVAKGSGGAEWLLPAFQRLRGRLQRMAASLLGDDDEAEDALQDAFCRLWPRRGGIRSEGEAAALFTTTVRNLSIDALRHRQSHPTVALQENLDAPEAEDAERKAETEERFREVERLVDSCLSPAQRQILRLKEYQGLDYETIARQMDMQPAAVRMALSRARKTIRECYKTYHHEKV